MNKRSQSISRVLFLLAEGDDHLSRTIVTDSLQRPYPGAKRAASWLLYSVLLQVGFAGPASRLTAGELLPRLSTLTRLIQAWRYISVALSLGSPLLGVTQHSALWSSDFPQRQPFGSCPRDHLINFTK